MSFFTSPTVAKQIEKEVSNEAKKEQKELKHVINDLRHFENRDAKAHKNIDKLERALEKNERKEQKALKELHKATQVYEQTKMQTVHLTEELAAQRKEAEHIRQELHVKKTSVDSVMSEKEINEQARLARLQDAKRYGSINRGKGTISDGARTASPTDRASVHTQGTHRTTGTQESYGTVPSVHEQPQAVPDGQYPVGQFPAQGGTTQAPPLPARPLD